ncbi:MAG TPA: TonB-dependent receptor [Dysgonomonas sp.]|nr:TonB-dependent receptor [Dysgonomonas sp.]
MRRKLFFLLFTILIGTASVLAQGTIQGTVIDKDTKEPLIGVSVFAENSRIGTATDLDGSFTLRVQSISGQIKLSYVGYKDLSLNAASNLGTIEMEADAVGLKDVIVTSSIAIRRKTPVALSVIEPQEIEAKMSNQEFPEILKSTPGVYATKQGGGFGDARVNIRGFESENVAVMVNGVPVNDMEWGGVYWSNWTGLLDVTRSMQVQRGLGASKVSAPSVGGTINIVTKSTDAEKGGAVAYTLGNDGYNKLAFNVSTGLMDNGWAITALGSKTWGDGYIMGTEFESYAYFLNISKRINYQHQISLTAFGSPQWHNQRYNKDYLTIPEWQRQKDGYKFNPTYGFDAYGQRVNPNRNRYHKPQISLNHSWEINDKSSLSTVAYVSIGDGAGRSWRGSSYSGLYGTSNGKLNMGYRDTRTGYVDYGKLQTENAEGEIDPETGNYKRLPGASKAAITESINNHFWTGLISTYTTKLSDEIDFYGGIDLRYYAGKHDGKIIDLMGGQYIQDPARIDNIKEENFPGITNEYRYEKLKVGDNIYRDNTGYVMQEGIFSQAEYNKDALSVFIAGAASLHKYWKKDYFYYSGGNQKSESKTFFAGNIKGGANYNIDESHNVFFNTGYVSRAPYMSGGYFTNIHTSNSVNKDAVNEKLFSAEIGYGFKSSFLTANLNAYYTKWMDKTMVRPMDADRNAYLNLKGVDAVHKGIELELVSRPVHNLELKGMISIGDWKWDSKVSAQAFTPDGQPSNDGVNPLPAGEEHQSVTIDMKGVKVGNSAQTTFHVSGSYTFFDNLIIGADYVHYANNYANYTISMPNMGETYTYYTPWKIPHAGVLDINARYKFKIGSLDATISGNINNVLGQEYISDAMDYYARNKGLSSWENVGVMYGFGRTWTSTLKIRF